MEKDSQELMFLDINTKFCVGKQVQYPIKYFSFFISQILGFDENGELTNYGDLEKPSWAQIVHKSSKIINFYDMGGSAKNFKKTSV